jgi:hypothetical protein
MKTMLELMGEIDQLTAEVDGSYTDWYSDQVTEEFDFAEAQTDGICIDVMTLEETPDYNVRVLH